MSGDAAIVWEIRTTGSQNNGGGFKAGASGTDYSQQDAAEDSGTDLATTDGIPPSGGTVVTSATHNFVAADVGNIIHITAGTNWTAGWYEILSVAANAATLDRACAQDGAQSGGTWYLGGAFKLGDSLDEDFFTTTGAKTAGQTVYIEAGTYTLAESIDSNQVAGTVAAPITIEGYSSTRGDAPTSTSRPTIDCGSGYQFECGTYWLMKHLAFTGSHTTVVMGTNGVWLNCSFNNTSSTADRNAIANGTTFVGCEFQSASGYAFYYASGGVYTRLIYCYIHDSKNGIYFTATAGGVIIGCVIDTCTTSGIYINGGYTPAIINNTIYNCTQGIILAGASSRDLVLVNNIIDSNSTYGVDASGTTLWNIVDFNCWNNNGTDINGSQFAAGDNAVTTNPALVSPASADFRIGSSSSAADTGMDTATYTSATV